MDGTAGAAAPSARPRDTARPPGGTGPPSPRARRRLWFAAAGVMLAAADTYVVVLALPSIMADVGVSLDQLQKAAPIISGFLLGYIVVLPLLGRLSDELGRRPVFLVCLGTFAVGSVMTAAAPALPMVVAGRTVQGLGGGGLVPVTLALVADLWEPERRGLPLGVVGGVQELGSVLGPLYGAVVVAWSGWRTIFWINVPVAAVLAAGLATTSQTAGTRPDTGGRRRPPDVVGWGLLLLAAGLGALALVAPSALAESDTAGQLYAPLMEGRYGALTTPMALAAGGALLAFLAWEAVQPFGARPLLPVRRARALTGAVDWLGAALLGGVLACIVVVFAAADPSRQVVAENAAVVLPIGGVLLVLFLWRELTCADPLVDLGALRDRAAYGSMLVNLAVGAALMAALVDIPIMARATQFPDSQVQAALVLVRLLAAVPVGAVLGGLLCERLSYRVTAAAGMALTATMLWAMTTWTAGTLGERGVLFGWRTPLRGSDLWLALCGLGFGLAIAPVNAAVLAAVRASLHGLASALIVVARMVGMLVGLSVLTAVGLRAFYHAAEHIPPPDRLCPHSPLRCDAYNRLATAAALDELHTVFAGAALCALLAAVLALALLRRRREGAAPSLTEALVGA